MLNPAATRPRASSTIPDLSETLISARRALDTKAATLTFDPQLLHFLPQRIAVDAQHLRGERLVALGVAEHGLDHRFLDVLQHHVVDRGGFLAFHVLEIALERALHGIVQLRRAAIHAASLSK